MHIKGIINGGGRVMDDNALPFPCRRANGVELGKGGGIEEVRTRWTTVYREGNDKFLPNLNKVWPAYLIDHS